MKRELLIVGAATIVAAGLAGCSSNNNSSEESTSTTTSSSATTSSTSAGPAMTAPSGTPSAAGAAQVTVGGQPQNVGGPVVCSTTDGKFSIAIGEVITGVIVGLEPDASVVHNIGLGIVNGVVLSYTEGVPGQNATATKTGSTYKITGTAGGVDGATGQQVSKPFEIDATCP